MEEIVTIPWMHSCLHFCTPFFEAYKSKGTIGNINARYQNNEALFVCRDCINILNSYGYSFFEKKKKCLYNILYQQENVIVL